MPPSTAPETRAAPARFVRGSIQRHILVMTGTSAIGLMSVFIGEFISMLYLGLLRDQDVLAAIGYAAAILFFPTSIGIGLSIAGTALISPAVGAGDLPRARRLSTNALIFAGLLGAVLAALLWPMLGSILASLGATGRTHKLAHDYLSIVIPSLPLTTIGMTAMSVLRSNGDAERAMNVPLIGSFTQLALEPFFIFMLKLGMPGAAIAYLLSRFAFVGFGLFGVIVIHRTLAAPSRADFLADVRPLAAVAAPAVLANVATPFANLFTTSAVATYGDAALAAYAIVGRIIPVAYGVVFSLTGAIGPIIGQNYGARDFGRVHEAFWAAARTNIVLCSLATLALILLTPAIIAAFNVSAEAAALILFYCTMCAPISIFLGMLFVANAAFNVLGYAHLATLLNWGRATLGTMPLVWMGGHLAGIKGVFFGAVAGSIAFGILGTWMAWRILPRKQVDPT
jgi:putative MATE family efflux protein